jgi:hypothetical protein
MTAAPKTIPVRLMIALATALLLALALIAALSNAVGAPRPNPLVRDESRRPAAGAQVQQNEGANDYACPNGQECDAP